MCKLPTRLLELAGKYAQGKSVLVDGDYDGEYLAQFKWYLDPRGYVIASINGKKVYLHRIAAGTPPTGYVVDHKNRNKLDCRSCNLRWVTSVQNSQNRPQIRPSASGYIGVQRARWKAKGAVKTTYGSKWIVVYRSKYVASFNTPEEAARCYDATLKANAGRFALALNFP